MELLIGEWTVGIVHPQLPSLITGHQRIEPILGGRFLQLTGTTDHPAFPDIVAVLDHELYHYFDSRGVTRTYHLSLDADTWTLWREDPDFYQRFVATISPEGLIISGAWETSTDQGATWTHDFAMTCTKVSAVSAMS
jgi:hypothetical protein